ncbi:FecR family protein [Chitinophaga solisilvae]|uniref:FecR family protein n=1 Tax=Chitinophaga solisilvae TaxID=1233460 RepID=UPI00136F1360|nr:FecR family protein [Chitinophaga solisilvae]
MDTEQIKILLERYNQGSCSPEEADIIDKWFEQINSRQSVIADDRILDQQLDEVKLRIQEHIRPAPQVRNMRPWYWSAAAAAVVLAAGAFWFSNRPLSADHTGSQPLAQLPATGSTRIVKDGFVEITTAKGARENITLPDGSTIALNAGSRLRYPVDFDSTERSVQLQEGEAYFVAAPDPARRFVVRTSDLATTALGTAFNIRAYDSENKVTVALISGKVKIEQLNSKSNTAMVLLPSEQISFDCLQLSMIKTSFGKPDEVTAWKQGYLVFKDAPYKEIVTGIENRYGVTVINQSNKTAWNYTGSFKNENLAEVMDIICIAKSLSYTIKKDTVYLVNQK